jgi:hypothetical protein
MRKKRGWSHLDTDEKLEALRADVNDALDFIEGLKKSNERIEAAIKRIAAEVFAMRQAMR